jgi:hypothetical protein
LTDRVRADPGEFAGQYSATLLSSEKKSVPAPVLVHFGVDFRPPHS